MAQGTKGPAAAAAPLNGISHPPAPAAGNRKKQKRREKQAAKQAAEAQKQSTTPAQNGLPPQRQRPPILNDHPQAAMTGGYDYASGRYYDGDGDFYSDEDGEEYEQTYGNHGQYPAGYTGAPIAGGAGKKSKKKTRGSSAAQQPSYHSFTAPHHVPSHPTAPPQPTLDATHKPSGKKDRIWNTNTLEERERIREFWLSLGEEERKSLVKIEKEAVLRKMKEQQKHSCSCTVCGRKRTAIEEELEVLYDAYYEELEQYANHQQDVGPILPPVHYASGAPRHRRLMTTHPPVEQYDDTDDLSQGDEEEGDEDYSNSEISSDEDYGSEERTSLPPPEADFLQFGSSLQVKGNIFLYARWEQH